MPTSTKKRREPPKRTRRVSAPFDDRLEVRCYRSEKAHLAKQAADRGLTVGDLIRFQLGDLLGPEQPNPAQTPPKPAKALETPPVDLTEQIAERFGITIGAAIAKIRLGKVAVRRELWPHTEIPADLIPWVTVDGELLVEPPHGEDDESAQNGAE